jgi:RNA polymerase sigma-B factor
MPTHDSEGTNGIAGDGDDPRRARDELIRAQAGLARQLARRFAHRPETVEDLTQVAFVGLILAADRFDPERGEPFGAFARATIVGELKRHLRDRSWGVRVPRPLQDLYLRAHSVSEQLTRELNRSPTIPELAARLGVSAEDAITAMEADGLRSPRSLDHAGPGASALAHAEDAFEALDARLTLPNLLDSLPGREREVVTLYYLDGLSQQEVAGQLGVSQMQVSRLLRQAVARLRRCVGEL